MVRGKNVEIGILTDVKQSDKTPDFEYLLGFIFESNGTISITGPSPTTYSN